MLRGGGNAVQRSLTCLALDNSGFAVRITRVTTPPGGTDGEGEGQAEVVIVGSRMVPLPVPKARRVWEGKGVCVCVSCYIAVAWCTDHPSRFRDVAT